MGDRRPGHITVVYQDPETERWGWECEDCTETVGPHLTYQAACAGAATHERETPS